MAGLVINGRLLMGGLVITEQLPHEQPPRLGWALLLPMSSCGAKFGPPFFFFFKNFLFTGLFETFGSFALNLFVRTQIWATVFFFFLGHNFLA